MAEDWKTAAKDAYGWYVDLYESVPGLKRVIDKAVAEKWTADRFLSAVRSSKWYKTKQQSELNYIQIKNTQPAEFAAQVADRANTIDTYAKSLGFTLSEGQLNRLANQAFRFDWSQQELAKYVGTEIARKPKEEGGAVKLTETQVAADIRQLASRYGITLTNKDVRTYATDVVTGTMSQEQLTDKFRNTAKTLFPSLSKQLDQGMTLTDIAQPYQNVAAQILEIDPTAIDITKPKYGKLFDFTPKEGAEPRMMSQTEWMKYVRSLPEWKKTENYRQSYASMANSLARIFGKVS